LIDDPKLIKEDTWQRFFLNLAGIACNDIR